MNKRFLPIIVLGLMIPPVLAYSTYREGLTVSPVPITESTEPTESTDILGATDDYPENQIYFTVNIPATFNEDISAPNIVYSVNGDSGEIVIDTRLVAGSGIGIEGRTITNTGILTLVAGTGITVDGSTITNSGITSLSAGTNISIDGSTITNTYTFTPDYTSSGWTDNGSTVTLTTTTDSVTVADFTSDGITITNANSILPDTDLGSDLGSTTLRFNNLWVANINSNSSQAFSGQTTFSYPPTDTTIDEASVLINPTTSAASGQLLGLAIAGYQKALIDEDGDIILGYSDATSAPASDYPLNIYGHSGTRVSFVDTTGNAYFSGNVGIGTTNPSQKLEVNGTVKANTFLAGGGFQLSDAALSIGGSFNMSNMSNTFGDMKLSSASTGLGVNLTFNSPADTLSIRNLANDADGDLTVGQILTSGNVGIGTTSPQSKLSVAGAASLGSTYAGISAPTNGLIVEGNVGIGTTSPSDTLHVYTAKGSGGNSPGIIVSDTTPLAMGVGGGIAFRGIYNGSDETTGGRIQAQKSNSTSGDYSFDLTFGARTNGDTLNNEKMRIQGSTGYIGINTTAPQSLLDVQGDAGSAGILTLASKELTVVDGDILGRINFNAPLESDGTDSLLVGASIWAEADDTFSTTVNSTELVFGTGSSATATEAMRIDSAGNVGIGTTSPDSNLYVRGSTDGTSISINTSTGSNGDYSALHLAVTGSQGGYKKGGILFERTGAAGIGTLHFATNNDGGGGNASLADSRMSINSSGNVTLSSLATGTVYSNSGVLTNTDPSDESLKNNILTLEDGTLDKLLGLRPVSFDWKSTGDGALGFIAQEVNQVFPELVGSNSDGTLGLYTTQFIPVLAKAIQEQQVQIDGLGVASESATVSEIGGKVGVLEGLVAEIRGWVEELQGKWVALAESLTTKEMCVGEGDEKTCLTRDQIDELIMLIPSPTPIPEPSSTPEPSVSPTPLPEPSIDPEASGSGTL